MSMLHNGTECYCLECGWKQAASSLQHCEWLIAAHNHDVHGGPSTWSVASDSWWQPPKYVPPAKRKSA